MRENLKKGIHEKAAISIRLLVCRSSFIEKAPKTRATGVCIEVKRSPLGVIKESSTVKPWQKCIPLIEIFLNGFWDS
jgi:hypothetical protein